MVFGSLMDLKAHMVEEHGADMSSKDKKAARQIQADFEFEEVGGSGRRGRRDRGDREREREPPPQAGPSRAANTGAAGNRRREAFGGSLTAEGSGNGTPNMSRQQSRQDITTTTDVDPAVLEYVPFISFGDQNTCSCFCFPLQTTYGFLSTRQFLGSQPQWCCPRR